jgi:sporulation protein YlmC with PRC-barrel domain
MTAAVAALLIAAAPAAYAAETSTTTQSAMATNPTGNIIHSDQIRVSKMIGSAVYDAQNRDIGKVSDVIIDRDGRVAAVVLDVGGFLGMGGKLVAINLSQIKAVGNHLTLDMTKEQLQQARAYQLEDRDTGAGTSPSPASGGHLGTGSGTSTAPRQ